MLSTAADRVPLFPQGDQQSEAGQAARLHLCKSVCSDQVPGQGCMWQSVPVHGHDRQPPVCCQGMLYVTLSNMRHKAFQVCVKPGIPCCQQSACCSDADDSAMHCSPNACSQTKAEPHAQFTLLVGFCSKPCHGLSTASLVQVLWQRCLVFLAGDMF